MPVNPIKTKTLVISSSRISAPSFPNLLLDGSVVEMGSDLRVLVVDLDTKLSFENNFS